MNLRRLTLAVASVVILASCQGEDPSTATPVPCLPVSEGFTAKLELAQPAKLAAVQDGKRWYVASEAGAVWVTTIDPSAADGSGMILPSNDEARAASATGADVAEGAPIYGNTSADSAAANSAMVCAFPS